MDWFGLGILLQAKDNASQSILGVNSALDTLTKNLSNADSSAEKHMGGIQESLNSVNAQMFAGLGMQQLGSQIMGVSSSMLSPLIQIQKQATATGSQFEQWRKTLKALYKDEKVAIDKLNWGLQMASQTPFEVTDVTEALIGFKAIGADADKMFTNANGQARSFLEYIGDLAALRPDVGLKGVMLGVRNLLGGDGGKSLRMRMDIDFEQILGQKWGQSTDEIMKQLVTASEKIASNLMGELQGTWGQMISNLEDQSTRFFLAVADGGAFDAVKGSLGYLSEAIDSIDEDKMTRIGNNIASAFQTVWKPIDFVARKLVDFGMVIVDLIAQSPAVAKFITTFISLLGAITAIGGALLIFGGTFLIIVNGIKLFMIALAGLKSSLAFIGKSMLSVTLKASKLALIGGLIYKAWQTDFGGVRSTLQSFMNNVFQAFSYSSDIAGMGVNDMMTALSKLDTNTFGGWLTYWLVNLKVLWMGLVDAWNDYTLSDENFQKLKELGLLPVLETILDLKMKAEAFFDGFKNGWKVVSDVVMKVVGKIKDVLRDIITYFSPVHDSIDEVKEGAEKLNTEPFFKLGEAVAYLGSLFVAYKIASKVKDIAVKIVDLGTKVGQFSIKLIEMPFKVFDKLKSGWETTRIACMYAKDYVGKFGSALKNLPHTVLNKVKSGWDTVKLSAMYAKDYAVKFKDTLKGLPTKILDTVKGKWDSIKNAVVKAKGGVTQFVTKMKNIPSKAVTLLNKAWGTLTGTLTRAKNGMSLLIGKVKALGNSQIVLKAKTVALNVAQKAMNITQGLWNALCAVNPAVWVVAGIVALIAIIVLLWNKCEGFRTAVTNIIQGIGSVLSWLWSNILQPVLSFVGDVFVAGFIIGFNNIKEQISNIVSTISGIINGLKTTFGGIVTFISGVFSGDWKKAWEGVKGIFKGVWDTLSSIAKAPLNAIIGGINAVIRGLNSLSIDIPDWVPGFGGKTFGVNIPEIPKLNTGGYIKDTGISMLHPNEVVINDPLTRKLREFLEGQNNPENNDRLNTPNLEVQPLMQPITVNMPDFTSLTKYFTGTTNDTNTQSPVTSNLPQRELTNDQPLYNSISNVSTNTSMDRSSNPTTVDNSIVFNEGSIQINLESDSDVDLNKLAKKIAKMIATNKEIKNMQNYKPVHAG